MPWSVDEEREHLRRKMIRMRDTVLECGPGARKVTAITLSDVANALLSHATVSDADLRETTYACPGCECPGAILPKCEP